GAGDLLARDGTHYTPEGYARLADAVVDVVRRQLTVRAYRPLREPASGPAAAHEYWARAAERDSLVPARYKAQPYGELALPKDLTAWEVARPAVYEAVARSLGDLPPRPAPPQARCIAREIRTSYTLESLALDNG